MRSTINSEPAPRPGGQKFRYMNKTEHSIPISSTDSVDSSDDIPLVVKTGSVFPG